MIVTTCIAATLLAAQGNSVEMRLMRYPDVHGDTVVFAYGGDLWSSNVDGGMARRLTSHPAEELRPKISPDGKSVAFTAAYDGSPDIYVMPIEGGEPKRLTYEPGNEYALGWTPDGKYVSCASAYGSAFTAQLWLVSPNGGMPKPTAISEVNQGTWMADGTTFVYHRQPVNMQWWRMYRGGLHGWISFYDTKNNKYWELPHGKENSWFPMAVGNSVFFISDRNQRTVNLFRYDNDSKRTTQITNYTDADIRWPSSDGKSIVFERDGFVYRYQIAGGKIDKIAPRVISDQVSSRPSRQSVASNITDISLSPSGSRIAVSARGEVFSLPAKNGETRNMTETPNVREKLVAWSNDGKQIAYFSDKTGEYQLYVQPQMGGEAVALTTDKALWPLSLDWSPDGRYLTFTTRTYSLYMVDVAAKKLTRVAENQFSGPIPYDWSPDSKWIAMTYAGDNQFGRVALYEVATGTTKDVTDGSFSDSQAVFDTTGKYLFFISDRTFTPSFGTFEYSLKVSDSSRIYVIPLAKDTPNPLTPSVDEEGGGQKPAGGQGGQPGGGAPATPAVKIDWDGLADRAIPLPIGPGNYGLVAGLADGILYAGGGSLSMFDFKSKSSQTVLTGPLGALSLNASRTKFAYAGQGGLFINDLRPGVQAGQGRVNTSGMETIVDPRAEWKQMYWEAWRWERDFFYDPTHGGQDWLAIGKRYEKYLDSVQSQADLGYVLGLLISELQTGHSYIQGFGYSIPNPVPTGLLGADYEVVGNNIRIKKILRGQNFDESTRAPLTEPGVDVREGDYILAVNGKPVTAAVNVNSFLVGQVGKTVVLTVNSTPTMAGAREERVRPVSTEGALRYTDWVESRAKMVEKLSGGRIGYMHIPNTSTNGAIGLIKGFYSQVHKEAVVVDERFNGGGFIQPWFVDTLARKIRAGIHSRWGTKEWSDAVAIEGPKAMLINGYAGSGGDFFPWMFRQSKLGPLIGMRTWGGLVGISGAVPLMDGSGVTAPEFGIYDRETKTWIAENKGVDPDIMVDADPSMLSIGRDPQLEKAVEYLLDQLKKNPGKKLSPPDFNKIPPPGGGQK
ncbi:MAG: PD40 domain-containing protein [Fimbriimonadaceae bacterium]|nr:PD40 domain-containing protein [Fimbriimonadaceae bacterium]